MRFLYKFIFILAILSIVSCSNSEISNDGLNQLLIGNWSQTATNRNNSNTKESFKQYDRVITFHPSGEYTAKRKGKYSGPKYKKYRGGEKLFTITMTGNWKVRGNRVVFDLEHNVIMPVKSDLGSEDLAILWNSSFKPYSFTEEVISATDGKISMHPPNEPENIMLYTRQQ